MSNQPASTAWKFHNATKYTFIVDESGEGQILMGTPPDIGPAIGEQDPEIEPLP
jgi:hypothetical protein